MDTMNIAHIAFLIRVLFVLAMIGLIVLAGALTAYRGASNTGRDAAHGPTVAQRVQRLPAVRGSPESNDPEAGAPCTQRRAA
jgi:hypothetical protein